MVKYVTAGLAALDGSRRAAATPAPLARLGLLPSKTLTQLPLSFRNGGTYPGYVTSREGPWDPLALSVRGRSGIAVLASSHPFGGAVPALIHPNGLTGWYRQRCRGEGVRMVQDTAQQRPEQKTPEQLEGEAIASLMAIYGRNTEIREALAKAWRCGFFRAQMQGHSTKSTSYINPFW